VSGVSGKAGLVTGAGSGIGRATALEFARSGAAVAVLDSAVLGDWVGGCQNVRMAISAGAASRVVISSSRRVRVMEQPAMSSDVQ
jgi:NAD(P)-dependent dehydrogenase (short-subunit alcohol dehydrogenase family)